MVCHLKLHWIVPSSFGEYEQHCSRLNDVEGMTDVKVVRGAKRMTTRILGSSGIDLPTGKHPKTTGVALLWGYVWFPRVSWGLSGDNMVWGYQ